MEFSKEQIEAIIQNLEAINETIKCSTKDIMQPQIDKQGGICPICNTLLGEDVLKLVDYHGAVVHKECANRDPWKVRDYCCFCLESKEQGVTIHTCTFHSKKYGYCPCREDCPAFINKGVAKELLRNMVSYKCGCGWDSDFVRRELKKISGKNFPI